MPTLQGRSPLDRMSPEDPEAQIRERLGEEAVVWLTRLTSGEATEGERARFRDWYAQSPAHARAFDAVAGLWRGLGAVTTPGATLASIPALVLGPGRARRAVCPGARGVLSRCLAAAVPRSRHGHRRAAERASADGSLAHLNTDTTLDLHFGRRQRRVVLNRGEAAFEVAKGRRPFQVWAGTVRTEAFGTEFLVRYDGEGGTVTLVEGRVRVAATSATPGHTSAALRLAPGQAVGFSGADLGPAQAARPSAAAAWRRGRLVMSFVPLGAVIAEINRYRRVPVSLIGTTLAEHRVNVAIELAEVDSWLQALTRSLSLKATSIGPYLVLREAGD